ncbi:MAG TPA: class I SAM-dependent methyltransferase [Bryobacteraceae bacterium]|nr:class I SAM-dependent methyltransferase [Bryobacteraceae bacterium]
MEQPVRHRRIPTHNQTGWASNQLNELSELFVAHCRSANRPVLDIGAAFGIASLAALSVGATVVANDLEPSHLAEIARAVPANHSTRLLLVPGRFPRHLRFAESSLYAIHASNVFHFLTGPQLEQGFASIAHWLAPGGKLFVQASTPFQQPFQEFAPVFLQLRKSGHPFPGWIADTSTVSTHRRLNQIPKSIHLLDDKSLRRFAEAAQLEVEDAWLYRRRDLPASLFLDGRESAALIARKPG